MPRLEPEIIKRYGKSPNERLYYTATLNYVSRAELSDRVLEGRRFVVRDAETGQDLTQVALDILH